MHYSDHQEACELSIEYLVTLQDPAFTRVSWALRRPREAPLPTFPRLCKQLMDNKVSLVLI